ncbi:hypothetical protein Ancab_005352 [Ancistrocladus abbreviatus]
MEGVMVMLRVVIWVAMLATLPTLLNGINTDELRRLSTQNQVTCLLVFGDSSVDPGNNNHLATFTKSNFPPYGKDFANGYSTGRFSNGKLATDFIVEYLGYTNGLRAFLDPTLKASDLPHGVSFASAGSGYDDLTANLSEVLPFSRQLKYFQHYKIHLRQFLGYKDAEEMVKKAVFVISMGSNDLLQNYFLEPTRSKQFSLQRYLYFLVSCMRRNIQELEKLGARRLIVIGVPPLGCIPIVRTLLGNGSQCVESINKAAFSLNSKIQKELSIIHNSAVHMKTSYGDIYSPILRAVNNPSRYGFQETSKGCCGSGTYEYGNTCKGLTTCLHREKYVFWDAIHPTEKTYKILADVILQSTTYDFFL